MDFINKFKARMAHDGIITEAHIIPDGQLHRFHVDKDKRGSRNGWYVLYHNDIPSGAFGNWKTSCSLKWCSKSRDQMTRAQWAGYRNKMRDAQFQRDQEKIKEHQLALECALQIWMTAFSANPDHPYLYKKGILPFVARQRGDALILPVVDCQGKIWSIQSIYPDGSKFLLRGGAKKSHFIPVNGSLSLPKILICEGYATGATLAQQYPRACIISAIDAGNLESVAVEIRRHRLNSEIIICADDDRQTIGNPGRTKARRAAIAAGALLRMPMWPENAPASLSDFNDLACWLAQSGEMMR